MSVCARCSFLDCVDLFNHEAKIRVVSVVGICKDIMRSSGHWAVEQTLEIDRKLCRAMTLLTHKHAHVCFSEEAKCDRSLSKHFVPDLRFTVITTM